METFIKNEINNGVPVTMNDLSGSYLDYLKESWRNAAGKGNVSSLSLAEQKFQEQVTNISQISDESLFSTENGCLLAKFSMFYGSAFLTPEIFTKYTQILKEKEMEFPVLTEIDQAIISVKNRSIGFFVSHGANFSEKDDLILIKKTSNPNANTFISTDINRIIITQNERRKPNETYSTSLEESENYFQVVFKK